MCVKIICKFVKSKVDSGREREREYIRVFINIKTSENSTNAASMPTFLLQSLRQKESHCAEPLRGPWVLRSVVVSRGATVETHIQQHISPLMTALPYKP